jgi:signal transduction histidine kinase
MKEQEPVEQPGGSDGPRVSLHRRLLLWVLLATAAPIALAALIQTRVTHDAIAEAPATEVALIGRTLSAALSGRLEGGWGPEADALVDAVTADPRVVLVLVTDPEHTVLHRRAVEPAAYRLMDQAGADEKSFVLDVGRTYSFGEQGELALRSFPVWDGPQTADRSRALSGYLLTGFHDEGPIKQARQLEAIHLGILLGGVVIVLPAVAFAVRRWLRPIRAILRAIHSLAEGRRVEPVPAHRVDEIGLLGEAFNTMAQRLAAAHDELRLHNEQLEELVSQRTRELEAANQKLADQINDKDQFLRSVSHDLGAPLRNIDGMAGMLLLKHRATLDDEIIRKLERIRANVKQETDLIGELVELSKLRTGTARTDLVDLDELVRDLLEGMSHQFDEAKITVSVEGPLPVLRIERTRIRQVFQNLIDNAAKYMLDAQQRRISIRAEEDLEFYRFSVEDTGRGIAWEDQPRVFQVFQRGTHSGTHRVQGRGVGLAGVKTIVEAHGGQIWVDSELGQGSTFTFTLARRLVSPPLETTTA